MVECCVLLGHAEPDGEAGQGESKCDRLHRLGAKARAHIDETLHELEVEAGAMILRMAEEVEDD